MKSPSDQPPANPGLVKRIRLSIFPDPVIPRTEAERRRYLFKNLILHFRPATVPAATLRFSLSWGLGGMAAVLVLLQFGTGVLLKFVYEPTPVAAYASIQSLVSGVPFGRLIRNLHHWCAHLLALVVLLHLLRVFFTGAFHPPRQFNWIIGLALLGLVLTANLSGYLLPWDQLAYWAVTVSTGMLEYVPWFGFTLQKLIRGGPDIGPATLRIFYAVHTAVVPILLLSLMGFHFWRVRRARGLVIPRRPGTSPPGLPQRVPSLPDLLLREAVVAAALIAVVMLLAIFFDAPLSDPANPGLSPNPTKAPWYFAGLQELLLHLHPLFAVFIIPLAAAATLVTLPYLNYESDTGGIWFASRTGRIAGIAAGAAALAATPVLILCDEWLARPGHRFSGLPTAIADGVIPFVLLLAAITLFYRTARRRFSATQNEAVQTIFIFLATALAVMTVTGVWFRGAGMKLVWPL
ncbi:MAG: cytochrome b N-terminal domain-containing protein [Desulfobacterales bacterium]